MDPLTAVSLADYFDYSVQEIVVDLVLEVFCFWVRIICGEEKEEKKSDKIFM